ncbi:MAG: TetR/AcrR family transcriptional regulator [Novosphingobium sp.]|nr:TetR/AcrR family transcriptional regulator [Novosphingobium sp.]
MARPRTTEPRQPDDARAQRSIEALKSALLTLLEQKPIEQITIKDITDRAGLSYPTFFRRFASKEELFEHIAREEVRALLRIGQAAMTTRGARAGAQLCGYVQSRRKLWSALLTGGASSAMRSEFMRVAREIAESGPRMNPWIPLDLAVPFVTSGIFEILAWWMRRPEDYPVEHVVEMFDALIVDVTARPRKFV